MYRAGRRTQCPTCHQPVPDGDWLRLLELRGPRGITSSDIDRIFDDWGKRWLVVEEKGANEEPKFGQRWMLQGLASIPQVTVLLVRGDAHLLCVARLMADGTYRELGTGDETHYQRIVTAWYDDQLETPEPPTIPDLPWEDLELPGMPAPLPRRECPPRQYEDLVLPTVGTWKDRVVKTFAQRNRGMTAHEVAVMLNASDRSTVHVRIHELGMGGEGWLRDSGRMRQRGTVWELSDEAVVRLGLSDYRSGQDC